jgi:hypothetical protein
MELRKSRDSVFLIMFLLTGGLTFSLAGCGSKVTKTIEGKTELGKAESVLTEIPSSPFVAEPVSPEAGERIKQILESEKNVLELGPYIADIGKLFSGKGKPRSEVADIFADSVQYTPLKQLTVAEILDSEESDHSAHGHKGHPLVQHRSWPIESPVEISDVLTELWKPITADHEFVECQFGTESGRLDESKNRFESTMVFEGKFKHEEKTVGVKAKQIVEWARINSIWHVIRWEQKSFDLVTASQDLFVDVTAEAIPDPATQTAVKVSSHEEMTLKKIKSNAIMEPLIPTFKKFNDWESSYQFPSVSVVDYDQDGWDDVFLLDRWSKGMLLRNQGDGTFKDTTKEAGLEVNRFSNCALFADFDNDGDQDLLLGRSVQDSMYYTNNNGVFEHDKSMDKELKLVRMVVSGSIVDINGDGLLDVYLATYAPSVQTDDWRGLVSEEDAFRLRMNERRHPYLDRSGPSNFVLMNDNGKLKKANIGDELRQWRNTYQSVWTDWDDDGDQDLYVCNDFSPDVFLRNDTIRGQKNPLFTDVSDTILLDGEMGFGMGANFGDFDSDGDLDLYVSNMYSKAGKRIIKQAGEVDPRINASARGNFLYQKSPEGFTQVAGLEDGKQHVSKVGWSFGGQFADFDNDGALDLYVPSGFYTAPEEIRSDADL